MNRHSITSQPAGPMPADDLQRAVKIARSQSDSALPHIGLVGDTYTVILSGKDTDGRYCLIDMHIPPGGGPPPHRHDFEESFTVLSGQIEATCRGETSTISTGQTLSIPAKPPHSFTNHSTEPAPFVHLRPAGQEEFFEQVGVRVATQTTPPPKLDPSAQTDFQAKAKTLSPRYRTELLPPPSH